MPTYEYRCKKCEHRFERSATLGEHEGQPKPRCPECKGRNVEQLPSPFRAATGKKT